MLADYGLDITEPRDNIEAAAIILSGLLERHPLRDALAAYAAGEAGMKEGNGYAIADKILAEVAGK